jgi:hypothetical protein
MSSNGHCTNDAIKRGGVEMTRERLKEESDMLGIAIE